VVDLAEVIRVEVDRFEDVVGIVAALTLVLVEEDGFLLELELEEVTLFADEVAFFTDEVFFAAATEDDDAEAWTHLQALLTCATDRPLTVDSSCLLASHDLQNVTGCLLLSFTVLTSLELQAVFDQYE
jgi:hypothetical protein